MNQKGGCGKTTTVVNLSAALAIKGGKVLVVDLDPQAHATLGLGVSVDKLQRSVYDLLVNPNVVFGDVMRPCQIPGLHILPSASRLASAQLELADIQAGEQALRSKLQNVQQHYDFILLDCPPTLNLLTLNALCYASKVLIPVQTHYYALEGMKELFRTIESVKQQFNPGLETLGILATLYDKRIKIAEEVLHALRDYFGSQMFKTVIHNNVKLIESPMVQQSVITYAPTSLGAIEYQQLAEEVLALVTKSN
ncbi:MAG: hypothetical protein A3G33_03560 [Omnitrophica bacterium RIFCSPLOWO2_12_FULL_44_17]|uniref:AAA domain-containing protein n=1 Tax=Candidatus Danuiimicrobium aquiferis TaxID=1801832 RepID=A0A1G1KTY6_9BACT|nr:MAG: hypothetical protein A3B72_07105 [Omnitrophica bacterium RIFCSPHIGHO2_02_FULL_45_28]OGW88741.1 MAG: hypothetical protein A3E74_05210 [Omnitrophica bacterium RIFCSPHIGHO2_12_FULL_44_12]OGW96398.1 MAG: hypothetical protein A3G33_03560 [Omnitrophica bacterium RIFCSPLOWO2_12_FULL_44_17]OGX04862.1 MAG: hypothetical protein A3J12_07570 [Omnitrophica bacterium RIFCSPLOWO2_02_FULL_44_11]